MATLKQHRKRGRERNTPFDAKCVTRQYVDSKIFKLERMQTATIKYGILLNKVDSLFYGFISRNAQIEDVKYVRTINILLNNFLNNHGKKKIKYYKIKNDIITKDEFTKDIKEMDSDCICCKKNIKIKINNTIRKKDMVCNKCDIKNANTEELILKLDTTYKIIREITTDNIKIIHDYQSKNLLKKANK